MSKEEKRNIVLAIVAFAFMVVMCVAIGGMGSYNPVEGIAPVFGNNGAGGNWWAQIGEGWNNWIEGFSDSGEDDEETFAVEENTINYIYERIRDDDSEVITFGELEADEDILKQLKKTLNNYSGEISIKAVAVDGTEGLSYNSDGEFFSASAIKAPYVLYGYKQMEQGDGAPDELMKYTKDYYHQGTGSMQYEPIGTEFSLKEIMRRTMWESDNVGYYMCVGRWGKDGYNEMMTDLGCESLVLENWTEWAHKVRAEDLLIVWKEIYDYMKEGTECAQLLYDSCTFYKDCGEYNFMGNALPGYTVSQKYGWSDDAYGDAAIVYGENRDYLLVVLTDSDGTAYDQQVFTNVVRLVNKLMDK